MPPWVAKEKIETLLLASEMPVSIPPSRTVRPIASDFRRACRRLQAKSFRDNGFQALPRLIMVIRWLGAGSAARATPLFFDCGRVLFGSRVAKREAEGTVHTKHQLNLDPNPEGT